MTTKWEIIEKNVVDEIIFRTTRARDRLIHELMARGGMRIGEVLKLRKKDHQDQKLVIQSPMKRYLSTINDDEAIKWIDNIYA